MILGGYIILYQHWDTTQYGPPFPCPVVQVSLQGLSLGIRVHVYDPTQLEFVPPYFVHVELNELQGGGFATCESALDFVDGCFSELEYMRV